jgi:hypothetical protein
VDEIRAVLKRHSNSEAVEIVKMISAALNLRTTSAFAPLGPSTVGTLRDSRGQLGPRMKPKAPPEVQRIKKEIQLLNKEISSKSHLSGSRLPDGDELLVRRNQLFRDLYEARNKSPSAH